MLYLVQGRGIIVIFIDVYIQFPEGDSTARAPPASKEVVAKLPVIVITNEILAKLEFIRYMYL